MTWQKSWQALSFNETPDMTVTALVMTNRPLVMTRWKDFITDIRALPDRMIFKYNSFLCPSLSDAWAVPRCCSSSAISKFKRLSDKVIPLLFNCSKKPGLALPGETESPGSVELLEVTMKCVLTVNNEANHHWTVTEVSRQPCRGVSRSRITTCVHRIIEQYCAAATLHSTWIGSRWRFNFQNL